MGACSLLSLGAICFLACSVGEAHCSVLWGLPCSGYGEYGLLAHYVVCSVWGVIKLRLRKQLQRHGDSKHGGQL